MIARRQPISSDAAPAAIGPYSQAIRDGEVLYCSGALPLDPADGALVTESLGRATERCG